MAILDKYLNNKFLKTLEPLSKLSVDKLSELVNKSSIEVIPAGRTLFRQSEKDKRSYYLVSGQIELHTNGAKKAETIKAKTPEAKYPIAQQIPRPCTAKTKVNSEVISIDTDLLEMLIESDDSPSGNYEVTELSSDDENGWMLKFLQSRAFLQIPTENIQKILMSMEEIVAQKGQTIVNQGESNDYYYIVKTGKCSVSRRPSPKAEDVQIAILAAGDGFGEEALITNGVRNATVRMMNAGSLMRLTKDDFISLLVSPLLDYIHLEELKSRANSGDLLIDVRPHKNFMDGHLDGAVNTPLSMIRLKLNNFNAERNTIVYCDDASRSTAAAFLLIQHGLSCSILKNGLGNANVATVKKETNKSNTSMTDIIADLNAVTNRGNSKVAPSKIHAQSAATQKKAQIDKQKLESEKQRLQQEAKSLREQAQAEKLTTDRKLQELEKETKKHKQAVNEAKQQAKREAQALKEKAQTEKLAAEHKLQQQAEQAKKHQLALKAKQQAEHEAHALREKAEVEKLAVERKLQQQKEYMAAQLKKQQQLTEESKQKIKQETAKIRKQADEELAELRNELKKTRSSVEQRVRTLKEKEKQRAEEEIKNRQQHANEAIKDSIEKARQQAAADAEKIRQQALNEAQKLQQEIELKKQQLETEAERIRLDAERDRATTLELARQQAQDIVLRTSKEAEYISSQRQELDNQKEQIRLQTEAERHATLEAAKEEALSIVRKTAEEAQQLDLQRQRIEEEVSLIKSEAAREKEQTLDRAKQDASKIRMQAERMAQQQTLEKVEQIRQKTLQQTEELKKQRSTMELNLKKAEEIRLQAEKEADQIRIEALQSATMRAEEIIIDDIQDEDNPGMPGKSYSDIAIPGSNTSMAESDAKSLAQEIVYKLEKAESNRIKEQVETSHNTGLSLSSASLKRRSDGRIVLEGEEDIFIFKEPKSLSKHELSILEASIDEVDTKKTSSISKLPNSKPSKNTELPEFIIEEPEFDLVDELPSHLSNQKATEDAISEFSDFELHQPSDIRSRNQSNSKRPAQRIVAIAASLFIAVGVSITFLGVNSEQGDSTSIAKHDNNSFNATRVSGLATNNMEIDKKVINDAEHEFEKLLSKWKKSQQKQIEQKDTEQIETLIASPAQ